jgi:hypothetical protein
MKAQAKGHPVWLAGEALIAKPAGKEKEARAGSLP